MPLVFSTSSVWVCSCLERFLFWFFRDQHGLSFGHPFCHFLMAWIHFDSLSFSEDESKFFKTRIRVCHQRLGFSSLVFLNSCFERVIVPFFQWCLSIQIFFNDLSVPIFCSKIVLDFLHPVVGMSLPILLQPSSRIFFLSFFLSLSFGSVSVTFYLSFFH